MASISISLLVQNLGKMPEIFRKDGYKFFFYSNEHLPIHVHVTRGDGDATFTVEDEIILRSSHNMKIKELSQAEQLVIENRKLIVEKWNDYFA